MARLAVFTDRLPDDKTWKGAFIWRLILSLAESHHQVMVLTTQEPEAIPLTHSRLTVVRPADKWRADQLPKFGQALSRFRPEIIHTFALNPQKIWSPLVMWPYLHGIMRAFPRVLRVSTIFDASDIVPKDPSWVWHGEADVVTVFSPLFEALVQPFVKGKVQIAPLEFEIPGVIEFETEPKARERFWLIPAPVSDWISPERDLRTLATELARDPDLSLKIIGGWGDWSSAERRSGWQILAAVSGQVEMLEPMHLPAFLNLAARAEALYMLCAREDSWRHQISRAAGQVLNRNCMGAVPGPLEGSTANFISRLYTLET